MEELQEIKIGDSEIALKNNLVKTSILPQSSKELLRNIKIQGNTVIEGSVFGNNISIEGEEVRFDGAVFANKELHIDASVRGAVTFKKALASAESVVALITSGMAIMGADVNAPVIRLKNCYVGGSIFGSEVYIENCVVLGGVFATKTAVISNSICGTFNAPSVEMSQRNYLLYPAGFSVEPLSFLPQTELYNLSLAHLGALYKGENEAENTGKIRINIESDNQRTVLINDEGETTTVNSYSVSGRVLAADIIDFEKLENHFLIGAGALGSQILKVYSLSKEDGTKSNELTVENIAKFFFEILDGKIQIQDVSGDISFSDLKKSFE